VETVYFPQTEDEHPAIRFPFFRKGEVINIKSRDKNKLFRLEKNAERIFYGLDDCTGETAIIVEGEMDKLSLYEAGIKHTVSVPDGAPAPTAKNYESKFEFLENCADWIEKIKVFVLAVDNDDPGRKLEDELARRLGKHRCKRVTWPEGCKDANDVLIKHGPGALREAVKNATDYPVEGIFEPDDLWADVERLYDEGATRGKFCGWAQVNDFYTIREGEFTVVTGIPGHGKSEWIDALMVNLANEEKWSFAVFSPENQPLERHIAKILEKFALKPFYKPHVICDASGTVIKRYPRMSREELSIGRIKMNQHFSFILPPEDKMTVDGILELATHVVLKKGIKGMVIDPWNEIDHTRPATFTETEYISSALSKIRRFARVHSVHIWLVAHPTKLQKDKETGRYEPPTPYQISGSAHWRNKADNCACVYRPDMDTDEVQVHIQKIRFKEVGRVGMATLKYDTVTGVYQ
jgi:twinkle protein